MTILNFIFIRHGHAHTNLDPDLVDSGICLGMTERGMKEATHAARAIATAGVKPAHILFSPVARSHQTALAIANELEIDHNLPLQVDALREREYGSWNGQNPEDMKDELIAGHVPEGSEDTDTLFKRLDSLLDQVGDLSTYGPVIAVSHGGLWQGLHERFEAAPEDIPWIETGDVFALRINRVAGSISSNCLFSPSGKHEQDSPARRPA